MSIEVAQPQELFASLPRENLAKIARQEGLPCEEKVSKKKIVESIVEEVEDAGIKQITSQLKKVQLEEICDSLDIDHGSNNPTKTVLRKRLMEIMQKQGLEDFFSKNMNADQIKIFLVSNGVTPASKGDKDALVKQAVDLVNFFGLQTFLNRFDTAFLQECMKEMKLRCNTDSKAKIVMAISTHSDAKKDKVNRDITFSEKKREIKKGITYQDIFQHYLKEEVEEWCRKNGLKVTGKKKELIERILAYLDGDTENTMAPNREKESKPEKKEKKETKKESKKESEKKETKEKAESPKNKKKTEEKSKKPKEESEEEEEEEEQDE